MDRPKTATHWLDYLVFSSILVISAGIGIFHGCYGNKQKTAAEYLLGGRKMRWVPVGLSILVTFQSAILYIGIPAEIYTRGTSYLLFHIGMAMSVVICVVLFVPLLFPLKLTSVYEYLERRFQSKTARIIGSLLGTMNMSLYMGVVIFAPATAMEAASGFPVWGSILLISAVATFYTVLGGLKAVIWTDVFQFVIMCVGLLAMLIQGCKMLGGVENVWKISKEGGRIDFSSFDPDPRTRHTVWSLIIGSTLTWLANIGVNQSNVQRFCAVPSLGAAKLAVLMSLPGFVIFGTLASLLGLVVYTFFADKGCDPLKAKYISNPNQLVPLFVKEVFDFLPGFTGLFIASLCCASLSTVSSSINSLAAMAWEDLLKSPLKHLSETATTVVIKGLVVAFGVFATCVALIAMQLGGPATQIALSFFGASGGPLLGMYLLGCLFPCANWIGVSTGAVTALTLCLWLAIGGYSIPPVPGLPPASVSGCNPSANGHYTNGNSSENGHSHVYNATEHYNGSFNLEYTTVSTEFRDHPLESFYGISYLWYSAIGLSTVLIVGLIVSFITGKTNAEDIEPGLIVPFFDKFCCCLPASCRQGLRCGATYPRRNSVSDLNIEAPEIEKMHRNTNGEKAIRNGETRVGNGDRTVGNGHVAKVEWTESTAL